ncbi:Unknown protein, partial [Striga hermonthica]
SSIGRDVRISHGTKEACAAARRHGTTRWSNPSRRGEGRGAGEDPVSQPARRGGSGRAVCPCQGSCAARQTSSSWRGALIPARWKVAARRGGLAGALGEKSGRRRVVPCAAARGWDRGASARHVVRVRHESWCPGHSLGQLTCHHVPESFGLVRYQNLIPLIFVLARAPQVPRLWTQHCSYGPLGRLKERGPGRSWHSTVRSPRGTHMTAQRVLTPIAARKDTTKSGHSPKYRSMEVAGSVGHIGLLSLLLELTGMMRKHRCGELLVEFVGLVRLLDREGVPILLGRVGIRLDVVPGVVARLVDPRLGVRIGEHTVVAHTTCTPKQNNHARLSMSRGLMQARGRVRGAGQQTLSMSRRVPRARGWGMKSSRGRGRFCDGASERVFSGCGSLDVAVASAGSRVWQA